MPSKHGSHAAGTRPFRIWLITIRRVFGPVLFARRSPLRASIGVLTGDFLACASALRAVPAPCAIERGVPGDCWLAWNIPPYAPSGAPPAAFFTSLVGHRVYAHRARRVVVDVQPRSFSIRHRHRACSGSGRSAGDPGCRSRLPGARQFANGR